MNEAIAVEIRKLLERDPRSVVLAILESSLNLQLGECETYQCLDDRRSHFLFVSLSPEGHCMVGVSQVVNADSLKARFNSYPSGNSQRVRQALDLLALAISIDNEERPKDVEYTI